MKLRVLLVDDHEMIRAGVRSVLEKHADVEIVGEAGDGRAAVRLAARVKPDVVITDVSMPELNGIEATRQILAENPDVRVIILSMHGEGQHVTEALKAGASGYLLKNSAAEELGLAVGAVARGKVYLSPKVAQVVVDTHVRRAGPADPRSCVALEKLSGREREVLQLIAEGKTNKEIAEVLYLSPKTVETHRAQLMNKLDIRTVADLTKFAIRQGLTPLEP